MKIGSVSIWLGNTARSDSRCITVCNAEVFIHGTEVEIRAFAAAILAELPEVNTPVAIQSEDCGTAQ